MAKASAAWSPLVAARRRQPSPVAAQRARELIDELCIDRPEDIDVELIAAHLGAVVAWDDLRSEHARLIRGKRKHLITIRRDLQGTPRGRFANAHEIGHLRLHPELDQIKACSAGDMTDYHNDGREAEANHFAAELLMPERLFGPLCQGRPPSLDLVQSLAETFRISRTAAGIQLVRSCPEPCALVFSANAVVQWAFRVDRPRGGFPFFIEAGRRLHSGDDSTLAGDLFAGKDRPRPEAVDASNWCDDPRARGRDVIEHSQLWASGRNAYVLSLLMDRGF